MSANRKIDMTDELNGQGVANYTRGWKKTTNDEEEKRKPIPVTIYLYPEQNEKLDRIWAHRKHIEGRKFRRWRIISEALEEFFKKPEYMDV